MNKVSAYRFFRQNYFAAYYAISDYLLVRPPRQYRCTAAEPVEYDRIRELMLAVAKSARDYLDAGGRRPIAGMLEELIHLYEKAMLKRYR